jgi:hypothetical protein
MLLKAGIAFVVGGMALSVGPAADARDARTLADRGVETTATVVGGEIRKESGDPYAVVDVEYLDELGASTRANGIVYCGEPGDVAVGDEVVVTYDPEEIVPAQFSECEHSQESTIPLVIGIVGLAIGTAMVLRSWWTRRWRRRWSVGIPLVILGILVVGTSFDPGYAELVYTGGALIVIGVVPMVAPRRAETPELPVSP